MNFMFYPFLLGCIFAVTICSQEAKYPFPQNVKYPYGVQSTKITSDYVKAWYDSWKKNYLQECNGNLRPGVDPLSKSLVEAQGFAMIAVAYMGDKETFDKLYNYYKSKCTSAGCGLMGWKQTCSGFEDQGSATDGDIDVACGLVVADWQWPNSGYADKAKGVLSNLKRVIANCGGVSAICGGCAGGSAWGGCDETDISYYEPAFFRYFAKISGDNSWSKLADDTHTIRDAAANATTGLVPDWQSTSGRAGSGSRKGYYSYDAIRTPYKQSLDFLWNGNTKAEAWCKKISTWAYGYGVSKINDGFQLNGTIQGSNHNLAVIGSLACAAMASTEEVLDAFIEESMKMEDDYWYSGYLGNLYLLALSGNTWNPEIVANKLVSTASSGVGNTSLQHHVPAITASNRKLAITGLHSGNRVILISLDGRQIGNLLAVNGEKTTLDISLLQRGCYIVNIIDEHGKSCDRRIVSVL